jgi:hypothetical protein
MKIERSTNLRCFSFYRYLLALLTYSTFMNKMPVEPLLAVANKLLESAPVVKL